METAEAPQTPFEVFCFNCKVTFPVGTRRCVHCGGRVSSGDRTGLALRIAHARASSATQGNASDVEVSIPGFPSAELPEEGVEETLSKPSKLSPFASVWIVLALVGALFRICSGG